MSCNRSWSSSVIDVPVSNPSKPPSDVDFATNDDDDDGLVALPLSFKFLTLSFDVVKFLYLLSWMRAPSPEDLPQEEEEEEEEEEEGIVDADATAHRRDDRDGDAEEDAGVLEGVATTNMIDLIDVDDNTRALLDFFFDDTKHPKNFSLFFSTRDEKMGTKKTQRFGIFLRQLKESGEREREKERKKRHT